MHSVSGRPSRDIAVMRPCNATASCAHQRQRAVCMPAASLRTPRPRAALYAPLLVACIAAYELQAVPKLLLFAGFDSTGSSHLLCKLFLERSYEAAVVVLCGQRGRHRSTTSPGAPLFHLCTTPCAGVLLLLCPHRIVCFGPQHRHLPKLVKRVSQANLRDAEEGRVKCP